MNLKRASSPYYSFHATGQSRTFQRFHQSALPLVINLRLEHQNSAQWLFGWKFIFDFKCVVFFSAKMVSDNANIVDLTAVMSFESAMKITYYIEKGARNALD